MKVNYPEVKTQPSPAARKRVAELAYQHNIKKAGKEAMGA